LRSRNAGGPVGRRSEVKDDGSRDSRFIPKSDQDAQIAARLAKAPGKHGQQGFLIRLADYPPKNKTADVTRVDVEFLDGKAYAYNFGYNGPQYQHVDDFVTKFIQGTSLPAADQWQAYPAWITR
jgi:hypothetical protein